MGHRVFVLCGVLALLAPLGCKTKAAAPEGGHDAGQAHPAAERREDAGAQKGGQAATLADALRALSKCRLRRTVVDPTCPEWRAYVGVRRPRGKGWPKREELIRVGRTHIAHPSPAVRIEAAALLRVRLVPDDETERFILARMAKEKHPAVVARLIDLVAPLARQSRLVRDMLIERAKDSASAVRAAAVTWLASRWGKGVKGALEKVIERIEKDPSPRIRRLACREAYRHGDERVLPTLLRFAGDPAIGPGCVTGLALLWSSPAVEVPSQKAFAAFMKMLEAKPRRPNFPPAQVMFALRRSIAAPWYDKPRIVRGLVDVVLDRAVPWLTRVAAVDALRALAAPKAQLEKLAKSYAGVSGNEARVKRRLERALTK